METVLRELGDVSLLSSDTNEARNTLLPLKSLPILPKDYGLIRRLCFLAPADLPPDVRIKRLSDVKASVDVERSEVIQYWRSYCDDGQIQRGRLFYTPALWLDDEWVEKSPEFVQWAERVVRAVKKTLIRDKERGAYVGPDAWQKIASGELKVIP